MAQAIALRDRVRGEGGPESDGFEPPSLRDALPLLRHIGPDGGMLSEMIADAGLFGNYKSLDQFMSHMFRLNYRGMAEIKFIEDELEGDDHQVTVTDMGKTTVRLNGD